MKLSLALACLASLATFATAQNTNQDAPEKTGTLKFSNGAEIEISYRAFTIAQGQTLRGLSTGGNAAATEFYNQRYIPRMLGGRLKVNATATLGGEMVEAGKYRFSFSIDSDSIWNLDVYTDTGKKSDGDDWDAKGWWQKETKLFSIALDTEDTEKDQASRLRIEAEAKPKSNDSEGSVDIRFGPLTASVTLALEKPAAVDAAADKSGAKPDASDGKADKSKQ